MGIVKYTPQDNTLIAAIRGRRYANLPDNEKVGYILGLIKKAQILTSNAQNDPEHTKLTVSEVVAELANYPWITCEELQMVFTEGVKGDYGQYFGINFKTIFQWIDSYKVREDRKQAIKKLMQPKEEPIEIDELTADKLMRDAIRAVFEDFKKNPTLDLISAAIYDWLDKNGYIQTPRHDKIRYMERAKVIVKEYATANQGLNLANIIKQFETGERQTEIVVMAKRLNVEAYFNQIQKLPYD